MKNTTFYAWWSFKAIGREDESKRERERGGGGGGGGGGREGASRRVKDINMKS